jgi:hypothetical protein
MRTINKIIWMGVLFFSGSSFATNSELVGRWVANSGDLSWARLEIGQDMVVTAYRTCTNPTTCDSKSRFRLTTYGHSKLFSPTHNIGFGDIIDTTEQFKAKEILEIRGENLVLHEYLVFSPKPGASNKVLQTIFTRTNNRLR